MSPPSTRRSPFALTLLVAAAIVLACPAGAPAAGTSTGAGGSLAGGAAAPSNGGAGTGGVATTTPSVGGTTTPTTSGAAASGSSEITVGVPVRPPTAATLARRHATRSGGLSDGAIVAAVLGALIVLACLAWSVLRFGAFEPRWLLSFRHSVAEAAFRTSATWAEFLDWVRLGH